MSQPTILPIEALEKCIKQKCVVIGILHKIGNTNEKKTKRDLLLVDETGAIVIREFLNNRSEFYKFPKEECHQFTVLVDTWKNEIYGKYVDSELNINKEREKELKEWYAQYKVFLGNSSDICQFQPIHTLDRYMTGMRINLRGKITFVNQTMEGTNYRLSAETDEEVWRNIYERGSARFNEQETIALRNVRVNCFGSQWQFAIDELTDAVRSAESSSSTGVSPSKLRKLNEKSLPKKQPETFPGRQILLQQLSATKDKKKLVDDVLTMLVKHKGSRSALNISTMASYIQLSATNNKPNTQFLTVQLYKLLSQIPEPNGEQFCNLIEEMMTKEDEKTKNIIIAQIVTLCPEAVKLLNADQAPEEDMLEDEEDDFLSVLTK